MALSSLLIIIAAAFLFGSFFGIAFRPVGQWCVHVWRRVFFRPKLLREVKLSQLQLSAQSREQSEAKR